MMQSLKEIKDKQTIQIIVGDVSNPLTITGKLGIKATRKSFE